MHELLFCAGIIALNFLVYYRTVKFGLISDDATEMKFNPFNIKRSKIISIVLHTTIALYIYFAFGRTTASLVTALLFSIHPVAVQVPCWWTGRLYGLNALIFLLTVSFAPFSFPLYCIPFFPLGVATTLFTPLVFIFTKYWYFTFTFPIIVWLSYSHIRTGIKNKIENTGDIFRPVLQKDFSLHKFKWINLILVVKTFGFYSLACLLPIKNGFYNSFLATLGSSKKATDYWYSFNRHFWGGLFAIVLMATVWWLNRLNFIGMGIMLFVCSIIPFLNFITVQQMTTPRYAYLALIGFQMALVGLVSQLPLPAQTGILGALFLFYLDRLFRVIKHYEKDNITMIELDSQVFPDNPRVWYFRYEHMLYKNNPIMAWAEATYGLKHLPEDCQLWFGLSVASFELGDMNAASEFLKTSERFMILCERQNMQSIIEQMKEKISVELRNKWKGPPTKSRGGFG